MKLNVSVTIKDIAIGGHHCLCCPVHRAIARAWRYSLSFAVHRPSFAVNHDKMVIAGAGVVGFPASVESWIYDYDRGIKVGPISFELELP